MRAPVFRYSRLCSRREVVESLSMDKPTFYEFFAGGGMARAGLGSSWKCLFANDFDRKKGESYRANWGPGELLVGDVRALETKQLPGHADLIWALFPARSFARGLRRRAGG